MNLFDLGYNKRIEKNRIEMSLADFEIGRIVSEHKERYVVKTETGDFEAEITGNLRFSASGREDFPAVGDWVLLTKYDSDFAIIHSIIPRFSLLARQAVGQFGELQIIAANVDFALLIQAVDRDFNCNRIERYLTICNSFKIAPIIVLTKIDIISVEAKEAIITNILNRISNVPIYCVSNQTGEGITELQSAIIKGHTYCMLGSSGVGKSTLLNKLSGQQIMRTGSISESTGKGKHVTSHRELIILDSGGIFIDNPGMREVGVVDFNTGLEHTFDIIQDIAQTCKFTDCSHTNEKGCAVIQAVDSGKLDKKMYDNFMKIQKEKTFFESTVVERRKKDKELGKILKDYHKKDVKGKNY